MSTSSLGRRRHQGNAPIGAVRRMCVSKVLQRAASKSSQHKALSGRPCTPTAGCGFPFRLGWQPKRLACLCAQPGTIRLRLEPANPHYRLCRVVEGIVVPVSWLGLTAVRDTTRSATASKASSLMRDDRLPSPRLVCDVMRALLGAVDES